MRKILCMILATVMIMCMILPNTVSAADNESSAVSVDWQKLLERPYTNGVPLGYNEDVYSLYQPGWGFDNPAIYRSGCKEPFGMKAEVFVDGKPLKVGNGTHTPSYVKLEGSTDPMDYLTQVNHARDADAFKQVSFAQTTYGATLEMAFDGDTTTQNNTWNTWDVTPRNCDEWLEVYYSEPKGMDQVNLWLYTDSNTYAPQAVKVQYWNGSAWADAEKVHVPNLTQGKNTITLSHVTATAFRFVFTPYQDKAMSFVEIELMESVSQIMEINHANVAGLQWDVSFAQTAYGADPSMMFDGDISNIGNNWNTWDLTIREGEEWLEITLPNAVPLDMVRLWCWDQGDGGNIRAPQAAVYYEKDGQWVSVGNQSITQLAGGQNDVAFDRVLTSKIRMVFTPVPNNAIAFYELQLLEVQTSEVKENNHAMTEGMKYEVSFAQTAYGAHPDMVFDGDISNIGNNWNTWDVNARNEDEWMEITLPEAVPVDLLRLWCWDQGPGGNIRAPKISVYYEQDGQWLRVENQSIAQLNNGVNNVKFDRVTSNRFRMVFRPDGSNFIAFYEIQLVEVVPPEPAAEVTGYKYISPDNMAVVLLDAVNNADKDSTVRVELTPVYTAAAGDSCFTGTISGFQLLTQGSNEFSVSNGKLVAEVTLKPGQKHTFKAATAFADAAADAQEAISGLLADEDPITTQTEGFLSWFDENVPYIDIPDENMKQIYYYRWYTYRSQIRHLADGTYVVTEFLPYVGWSGPYNTINMPLGSHAAEGRWIRDTKYLNSALTFWTDREGTQNARAFSTWLPTGFYNYYLVTRDSMVPEHLDALKADYAGWESTNYHANVGLFWSNNGADGMEYSAVKPYDWGVNGYRPTVNAYRYGDAMAIAALCELNGDTEGAELYLEKAAALKAKTEEKLFDSEESFYKWMVMGELEQTDPMELIGYVPWMFGLATDDEAHAAAWQYLISEDYFAADFGPRTVEKSFARKTPAGEYGSGTCRWDGPSWPFATSQTLNAMANLLNDYQNHGGVDAEDYAALLRTYANSHYKDGYPWIAEDLDADTGKWIADIDRSVMYNHSEYVNLMITGLLGLRPELSEDIVVNPLVPANWDYFCLENVRYNGKNVTVLFDRDGSRYGKGAGFQIIVDGEVRHTSETVQAVRITEQIDNPKTGNGAAISKLLLPIGLGAVGVAAAAAAVFGLNRKRKNNT